eukprot:362393-Chlamydomonas_euryale.AAC.3
MEARPRPTSSNSGALGEAACLVEVRGVEHPLLKNLSHLQRNGRCQRSGVGGLRAEGPRRPALLAVPAGPAGP